MLYVLNNPVVLRNKILNGTEFNMLTIMEHHHAPCGHCCTSSAKLLRNMYNIQKSTISHHSETQINNDQHYCEQIRLDCLVTSGHYFTKSHNKQNSTYTLVYRLLTKFFVPHRNIHIHCIC